MGNPSFTGLKTRWEAIRFSTFDLWKSVVPKYGDQRAEPRFESAGEASVRVLDPSAKAVAAWCVSTSRNGLGLTTPFIFPRQFVEVRLNARTVAGEVRYCRSCAGGYQLGIRLYPSRFIPTRITATAESGY
jgi:hypothetical protein